MEDLEILKNNWEKENQLLVFSKEEIFEMMRRKSLSISRTLLWIGCLEVVLWILFFYIDSNSLTSFLDWKLFFRSVLFLFFIFIIIYSYLKINNESDARSLMKQILNLRKMILIYIILMIISIILLLFWSFVIGASAFILNVIIRIMEYRVGRKKKNSYNAVF